ncbi:Lon protease-like protein 2, peroxisomal [Trichoplax sp. H2]|nr:Lon protease-like protein 2, peroxisomal [Trichoplax sp. H2]|eukprot:RDD43083.1 Lon protease-like protein 2, peroxisomal [Trichoplax sp. H2]
MAEGSLELPSYLAILTLADEVLLPGSSIRVSITDTKGIALIRRRLLRRRTLQSTIIGVVPKQRLDEELISQTGTAALVVQITGVSSNGEQSYSLLLTGLCRFKVDTIEQEHPYCISKITQLDRLPFVKAVTLRKQQKFYSTSDYRYFVNCKIIDSGSQEMDQELANVIDSFRTSTKEFIDMLSQLGTAYPIVAKLKNMVSSLPAERLPDLIASVTKLSFDEKLKILNAVEVGDRFKKTLPLLLKQIEGLKLLQKHGSSSSTPPIISKNKVQPLMTPTRTRDLNDLADEPEDEVAELQQKINNANLPPPALKAAKTELKRLKKMPPQLPDYSVTRNYLEWMVDLPWKKSTEDKLDINKAKVDLDDDHFGMKELKKRVLEYLAVRQLRNDLKGPILCFVGPPGVGKTSVGRSIAKTLGREFLRISLGGVSDQSEIRGHRRTYIGSMPGRIIQGLKNIGVNNPVFLLDEVDKLSKGIHGDPAAALLEVMFIATANTLHTIPSALLDRMEVIEVPGYTQEEKVEIGARHLVAKQLTQHGLRNDQLEIPSETIKVIVSRYTREAGVRSLERKLGAICRAAAIKIAERSIGTSEDRNKDKIKEPAIHQSSDISNSIVVDESALKEILGPHIYEHEASQRLTSPGIAVGLAWTPMGGEILFVEASKMIGDGKLKLTGQLGDVMRESAYLALTWLKSHPDQCGLSKNDSESMNKLDIHIHFPAGAVEKDGPSAGITITTVLVSLFSAKCVRSDTAMTGEITLRGQVLPVGGIKEKSLAAHRAGIKRVIIPQRNLKDLEDVPENVKKDVKFIPVKRIEDALEAAFISQFPFKPDSRL